MQQWLDLYSDPLVRRAVEPVVEVINGATRFVEPRLLMTILGLDAMGHFRDPLREPGVPLRNQIERCLLGSALDVSALGSVQQVALAIAHVNNDIKQGLREPLKEFNLATEPWLFVVNAKGVITARLEGSIGVTQFENAVKSGL